MNKLQLLEEAKARVKSLDFGRPVTNICAGHPERRHAYFCQLVTRSNKNRFGTVHRQYLAKLTDRKGKFWNVGIEVIFPDHLPDAKCDELFYPIWQALYA